jgi:mannose-6-phosphate isomerase-like protein (cupin superfamily)
MAHRIDRPVPETHDVFRVVQLSPGTVLEDLLGADFIEIGPNSVSEIHRHNDSENVVFIISGPAIIILDDEEAPVAEGDRIYIGRGVFHGFRTSDQPLRFVSIQVPPILDRKQGIFDREIRSAPVQV